MWRVTVLQCQHSIHTERAIDSFDCVLIECVLNNTWCAELDLLSSRRTVWLSAGVVSFGTLGRKRLGRSYVQVLAWHGPQGECVSRDCWQLVKWRMPLYVRTVFKFTWQQQFLPSALQCAVLDVIGL